MSDYKKEIMEEIRTIIVSELGHATFPAQEKFLGVIQHKEKHINRIMDFLSQALTRVEEAITYDNISIGWDHDCHYRYVFAIQNGQIIYKERVSDDSISHLDVVRQIDIENYVKSKLPPSEENSSGGSKLNGQGGGEMAVTFSPSEENHFVESNKKEECDCHCHIHISDFDCIQEGWSCSHCSSKKEKISFEEGEKIVKKIQQKVESYRATPRYDQGGYHPSEDSVLACVCHCHNNVTHFPGGCMFCSCIHCHPSPEEWEEEFDKLFVMSHEGNGAEYLFRVNPVMQLKNDKGEKYDYESVSIARPQDVKQFIRQELASQKERIRKAIEGIRHEDRHYKFDSQGKKLVRLDDVLKLLEGDSK